LKSELECLRSIDASVGIIKRILIWWLVVSFLGAVAYTFFRILPRGNWNWPTAQSGWFGWNCANRLS